MFGCLVNIGVCDWSWRVPGGVLGITFGHRSEKGSKQQLCRPSFLTARRHLLLVFSVICFLHSFETSFLLAFLRQRHLPASISKAFGCHLVNILSKSVKAETVFPCGREHENQALEGLCFNLFCPFHLQVFGTSVFHDSFDDFVAFVYPFDVHF